MNIFQPAIDIEPLSLQREVTKIYEKLKDLGSKYKGKSIMKIIIRVWLLILQKLSLEQR